MAQIGTTEILLILAVVLLLFGAKRLPELSRSIGRSARILKSETRGLRDDSRADSGIDSRADYSGSSQPSSSVRAVDDRPDSGPRGARDVA